MTAMAPSAPGTTPGSAPGSASRRGPSASHPPRLFRWVLYAALPTSVVAEAIAGDLEQEFRSRLPNQAKRWYRRQVMMVLLRSTGDRLRGRSWFRLPPSTGSGAPGTAGGVGGRGGRRGGPFGGWTPGRDLCFALRMLVQRPVFAATAIVTLAVGIGANTAIFSVTNALLLRPVPAISEPAGLVTIARGTENFFVDVAYGAFERVRTGSSTLDGVAGFDSAIVVIRDAGEPEVVGAMQVTGNYFDVLGVRPALGRFPRPDESFYPEVADAVVIGYDLWQRRYGGRDVIGERLLVNGYPTEIIGVAAEDFGGHVVLRRHDLFVPLGLPASGLHGPPQLDAVTSGYMSLIGRIASGVTIEAVRAELTSLGDAFYADNGRSEPYNLRVDAYTGLPGADQASIGMFFLLLTVIVGMVLVIACVNVANMLLSRATDRTREIAIRLSVGATRGRVVAQLLTESTVLFALGALAGSAVAIWTTELIMARALPQQMALTFALDVGPDARVIGFVAAVALVGGLIFGLLPALAATRPGVLAAVRSGGRAARRSRVRGLLVGAQMATALVLLIGAGLMVRALQAARDVDLGFRTDATYSLALDLELAGYDAPRSEIFYRQLLERVRALPTVEAAATARKLPLGSQSSMGGIYPEGIQGPDGNGFSVNFNRVSDDYFQTIGMSLAAGRGFDATDTAASRRVAVINETMAARIWGAESAIGRRFTRRQGEEAVEYEVIGVTTDALYHGLMEEVPRFVYFAASQMPDSLAFVIVRTDDPQTAFGGIRAAVESLDADVPLLRISSFDEMVEGYYFAQQIAAWVAGVVGIVGLLLGAVGIYGVTAYATGQRSQEIGVRMALGARAADVVGLVMRSELRAPLAGALAGLLASVALGTLVEALLFGVSPLDPATYLAVLLLLGGVASVAILLPARRATRLDPVSTLRAE